MFSSSEESFDETKVVIPEPVTSAYLIRKRKFQPLYITSSSNLEAEEADESEESVEDPLLCKRGMAFAFIRYRQGGWDALERVSWAKQTFVKQIENLVIEGSPSKRRMSMRLDVISSIRESFSSIEFLERDLIGGMCDWCGDLFFESDRAYVMQSTKGPEAHACEKCCSILFLIHELYKTLAGEIEEFQNDVEDEFYIETQRMLQTIVKQLVNLYILILMCLISFFE